MDALTQLPNRRRLEVDIDAEWDRSRRYGRPLSLVMIDLDHFKSLNDDHGHLVGDVALREVAAAVAGTLRSTDTAYRFGGEELVVLMRESGLEDAALCAERIRSTIEATRFVDHPQVTVTASLGVATRHAAMTHHTEMTAEADACLYVAKRGGRNRVVTSGAGAPDPAVAAPGPGEMSVAARSDPRPVAPGDPVTAAR